MAHVIMGLRRPDVYSNLIWILWFFHVYGVIPRNEPCSVAPEQRLELTVLHS
jgi:hypothetical protein